MFSPVSSLSTALQKDKSFCADVFGMHVHAFFFHSQIMLCGRFPFWGKTDIEYMRSLARGPCMEGEGWNEVSDEGKAFLREMLQLDPKQRLTAEQALVHPWIMTDDNFNRRLSSMNGLAAIANKMKQRIATVNGEAAGAPGKKDKDDVQTPTRVGDIPDDTSDIVSPHM